MCGRYYIDIDEQELRDICDEVQRNIDNAPEQLSFSVSSGEIFPTNIVPVRVGDSKYQAMKWGFTGYDKKPIINARSETALIKPTFKKPMIEGRCLIPASSYFEWQRDKSAKQKYRFTLPDRSIMYMAGCYRVEPESKIASFVILTKDAVTSLQEIHNRMPVIIPNNMIDDWLNIGADVIQKAIGELSFEVA